MAFEDAKRALGGFAFIGFTESFDLSVAEMQRRAYELGPVEAEDEEELLVEDLPQRIGEIEAPTLVLVGEEDVPDMQAIAQRLASEIPGARFEKIANTAHVPSMERPEEFDRLVLGFVEGV